MRTKLRSAELLALMAAAGVMTTGIANAADNSNTTGGNQRSQSLKADKVTKTELGSSGKNSACGKGACGTDESGAKAAKAKHAKVGNKSSRAEKQTTKKSEKEQSADKQSK